MSVIPNPARLTFLILCVIAFLTGCGSTERRVPPVFAAPEQALDYYIRSLRAGDLEGIVQVTHPPRYDFYLPGPITIKRYDIILREVIDQAAAAKYEFIRSPQAGDVRIDVVETDGYNIQGRFSYYFREIDGSWKLYAWSGWGTDDFLD